ncbi:uncharacterized protein LOC121631806 [Melanotaenia boesemani]|uniref:uncharacterized protein LOC121631806 n=1 Tax=Melanotaenia boesemani TaxID=1250792 RepID=UPI001C0572D9|nr:uncharacterized protein LOC121631806 [Melanotaenia boesemani]
MPEKLCGLCFHRFANLRQHLRTTHFVPNKEELALLLKWGSARTTSKLQCPICKKNNVCRLDKHLQTHHHMPSDDKRARFVARAKRTAVEEEFRELRQANPTPEMVSTLGQLEEEQGSEEYASSEDESSEHDEPQPRPRDQMASTPQTSHTSLPEIDLAPIPSMTRKSSSRGIVSGSPAPSSTSSGVSSCHCSQMSCTLEQSLLARIDKLEKALDRFVLRQQEVLERSLNPRHWTPRITSDQLSPARRPRKSSGIRRLGTDEQPVDLSPSGDPDPPPDPEPQPDPVRPPDLEPLPDPVLLPEPVPPPDPVPPPAPVPPPPDPDPIPTPSTSASQTVIEAADQTPGDEEAAEVSLVKGAPIGKSTSDTCMYEKAIEDFRQYRVGARRKRKDKENANTAARHCHVFCTYMLGEKACDRDALKDLRFLTNIERLRKYPVYLTNKGYAPTSIRNMMINATLLYRHVEHSFLKKSRLKSSDISRIMYELKKIRADVNRDVLLRRQKVRKEKTDSQVPASQEERFLSVAKRRIPELLENSVSETVSNGSHTLLMGYAMGYLSVLTGHRSSIFTSMRVQHVFNADSWEEGQKWQILIEEHKTAKTFGHASIALVAEEYKWMKLLAGGVCCPDGPKSPFVFHTVLGGMIHKPNLMLASAWRDAGCSGPVNFTLIRSSIATQADTHLTETGRKKVASSMGHDAQTASKFYVFLPRRDRAYRARELRMSALDKELRQSGSSAGSPSTWDSPSSSSTSVSVRGRSRPYDSPSSASTSISVRGRTRPGGSPSSSSATSTCGPGEISSDEGDMVIDLSPPSVNPSLADFDLRKKNCSTPRITLPIFTQSTDHSSPELQLDLSDSDSIQSRLPGTHQRVMGKRVRKALFIRTAPPSPSAKRKSTMDAGFRAAKRLLGHAYLISSPPKKKQAVCSSGYNSDPGLGPISKVVSPLVKNTQTPKRQPFEKVHSPTVVPETQDLESPR